MVVSEREGKRERNKKSMLDLRQFSLLHVTYIYYDLIMPVWYSMYNKSHGMLNGNLTINVGRRVKNIFSLNCIYVLY